MGLGSGGNQPGHQAGSFFFTDHGSLILNNEPPVTYPVLRFGAACEWQRLVVLRVPVGPKPQPGQYKPQLTSKGLERALAGDKQDYFHLEEYNIKQTHQ